MNHKAIFAAYPNAALIRGDKVFDANGDEIIIDNNIVLEKEQSTAYVTQRKHAYPSIEDQLDLIFHEGIAAWKAKIQSVKDQFPKS